MNAGLLDTQIIIQSQTQTQDATGQPVLTWTTWNTVWADVIPIKNDEIVAADRKTETSNYRARIRYISGLTEDMRVVFNSKNYDITSINLLGRDEGWEIFIKLNRQMS